MLHMYPYHVDSLIQLSEVSRIHDDTAMASDLMGTQATHAFAFCCCFVRIDNISFDKNKNRESRLRLAELVPSVLQLQQADA